MALDQSALLEVLDVVKASAAEERIRLAAETVYQALIDAEATAVIGAGPWEHSDARTCAGRTASVASLLNCAVEAVR